MARSMTWEDARVSGLCLGALLSGDRSLSAGEALGDDVRRLAEARLASWPRQGAEKIEALRALVAELRPRLEGALEHLPLRARGLVAQQLPRAEARALLRG